MARRPQCVLATVTEAGHDTSVTSTLGTRARLHPTPKALVDLSATLAMLLARPDQELPSSGIGLPEVHKGGRVAVSQASPQRGQSLWTFR